LDAAGRRLKLTKKKPVNVGFHIGGVVVTVQIKLDSRLVAKLDHSNADCVCPDHQLIDDCLREIFHPFPVSVVVLVDTSRRVDDEDDVG
jgi:hypothetical protein